MAQGKAFTPEETETIIQSLRPYLEMGFSRNKACSFIGLPPQTLSNWVKENESLGIKLVSWENVNTALALANIHQALKNESILATEKGDVRMDNSWKLVSKLEDGYKDKLDVTSNDKTVVVGGFTFVKNDDNNTTNNSD
ncbi:MAG: hypothetical protein IPO40_24355 [Fibrobacteres bacterium]|nr:hypothetical protein [Fibrobacterota bacterium]